MSPTDVDIGFGQPLDPILDQFICELGFGCNPGELKRACRREVARMNMWSDRDLRMLGITRREIPHFVLHHRLSACLT